MVREKESQPPRDVVSGPRSSWNTIRSYTVLSVGYIVSDVQKRPRNTFIGVLSIFIVVFFIGLVLTAVSKTPYVLLRFAELQVGEMDAMVLASGSVPFINYTFMAPKINAAKSIASCVPRWLAKGELQSKAALLAEEQYKRRNNITSNISNVSKVSTNVLVIDSSLEKNAGVGRAWPYREIGFAETQVYHSALRYINVRQNVGERVRLFVDAKGLLAQQGVDLSQEIVTLPDPFSFLPVTLPNATLNLGNLSINIQQLISALSNVTVAGVNGSNATSLLSLLNQSLTVTVNPFDIILPQIELTVADAIKEIEGKYPALLGNMVIVDYRQLIEVAIQQSCLDSGVVTTAQGIPVPTNTFFSANALRDNFRMQEYALIIVAMFRNRFETYYKDQIGRTKDLIRYSNELFLAIGVDFSGAVNYPLSSALDSFYFLQLFLDSVFTSVVVVIIVLGSLLVYMLLVTNADERQFEIAMIRAQGMPKSQLFHLMVTQAVSFVVPGIVLGICLLLAINAVIEVILSYYTKAPAKTNRIPMPAVVFAVLLGVVMPIVANWGPVKSAMARSLRDALDVYRQKNNETKVTLMRLAELGLEPWQTMLGWFLTLAGFVIYYMIPFSFIFNNLWLFFLLLNLILLTMLFGLCMISYSIQGVLERFMLRCMLWGNDRRLRTLIERNFYSHKDRNAKTFMMFTISVACIVFGGVLFTLLASSLTETVKIINGADVSLTSLLYDQPLDRESLEPFLQSQRGISVEAWSFTSFPLRDYGQSGRSERVSNLIGFPRRSIRFVGIDEFFQDAVYPRYVLYTDLDRSFSYDTTDGNADVVRSMFRNPPSSTVAQPHVITTGFPPNISAVNVNAKYSVVLPCVLSSAAKDIFGFTAGSFGVLDWQYLITKRVPITTQFLMQPRALARKVSGFPGISALQFGFNAGAVLIPLPEFTKLLSANKIDFSGKELARSQLIQDAKVKPQFQKLFLRLRPGMTSDERTDFVNLLQSQVNPYYHIPIDTSEVIDSIQIAADLINYFYYFISAVALILDAFMLWLAFVSNVQSQAWSFGVLRSLGFTVSQLIRTFVYEALSIVLSSFVVGTVIGILVAVTLTLQMNLFLDLRFTFSFPIGLYFFLLGLSLCAAIIGSWIPAREISRKPIASVLKNA